MSIVKRLLEFVLSIIRTAVLLSVVSVLFACSSRQPFQSQNQRTNSDQSWWQCDPKGEREWRCSDGQKVEETVALINTPVKTTDNTHLDEVVNQQQPIEPAEILEPTETNQSEPNNQETIPTESATPVKDLVTSPEVVTNEVQPEQVANTEATVTGDWLIQLGAFRSQEEALKLSERISDSRIEQAYSNGETWYRVVYGTYLSRNAAEQAASEVKAQFGNLVTWVRRNR